MQKNITYGVTCRIQYSIALPDCPDMKIVNKIIQTRPDIRSVLDIGPNIRSSKVMEGLIMTLDI